MACIRKPKQRDVGEPTQLLKAALQSIYLDSDSGQINISAQPKVVEAKVPEPVIVMPTEYKNLNDQLAYAKNEVKQKEIIKEQLTNEVRTLKHMFIANTLDINEFSKIIENKKLMSDDK